MSHKGCIIIYTPHYNTVSSHACSEYSRGKSPSSQRKWHFVVGCASGKESTCQCRRHKRHGFNPWVGKIPWRRAWQPTLVFLPGESPWPEEPGGLWSTGSYGVRHSGSNSTAQLCSDGASFTAGRVITQSQSHTAGSGVKPPPSWPSVLGLSFTEVS